MKRLCCTAQFVAALVLSGCGTAELFREHDLPESPEVAAAPWPRLVDTPSAPPPGSFSSSVPDPQRGVRTQTDLAAEAVYARRRAEELSAPVLTEEQLRRLEEAPKRR